MHHNKEWQQRALVNAHLIRARAHIERALQDIAEAHERLLHVDERVMNDAVTEAAPPSQTELRIEPLADDVPEWVQILFEAMIARLPKRETARRITSPFDGWEVQCYPSDLAKWRGIPAHTSEEVKVALETYRHPRVQWVRPGNVQLCRIRDAR